jgi:fructose-1-phosphate kinase PfkB-like protein
LESRGGRLIAKLNRDELAGTLNEPLDTDAALHDAMRRLIPPEGSLIITLGKAGSLALFAGRLYRVTPPAIRSVSAVGSGDAFTAGLIAGIGRGIEHALKLATACGAANALTPHSGHLHRADVDRLIDEVRIQSIE